MGKFIKKMAALVTSLSSLGVVGARNKVRVNPVISYSQRNKKLKNAKGGKIVGYDHNIKKRKSKSSSIMRKVVYTVGGAACVLFIVGGVCIAYNLLDGKGTRSLGSASKEDIDKLKDVVSGAQKLKNGDDNLVGGEPVSGNKVDNNAKPDKGKFDSLAGYIRDEFISSGVLELHKELMGVGNSELEEFKKISKDKEDNTELVRRFLLKANVSSNRSSNENKNNLTSFEKKLDELVDNEDLPLKQFSIKDIDELYDKLTEGNLGNSKETFVLKTGIDALELYEHASDGAIVQVASQFNALESAESYFSPVKEWINDHTQGPRASLQAVIASKHRESAYLKGKLPDALEPIIKESGYEAVSDSYKCGYLKLFEIKDANVLEKFNNYIKKNIGSLGINAQWVMCANGRKQFQVFAAAPSFQGHAISDCGEGCQKFLKDICNNLVVAQYKALAKIAVIKSILNDGKQAEVHLTRVGQGAFQNPPEIMTNCLREVGNIVKGRNIKVVLHSYTEGNWNKNIDESDLKVEGYN